MTYTVETRAKMNKAKTLLRTTKISTHVDTDFRTAKYEICARYKM